MSDEKQTNLDWGKDESVQLTKELKGFTDRTARVLACLTEWQLLHYTGHFNGLHPEMKERVNATAAKTEAVLAEFKLRVPSTPAPCAPIPKGPTNFVYRGPECSYEGSAKDASSS